MASHDGGQHRVLDPLELDLELVVSCHMGAETQISVLQKQ